MSFSKYSHTSFYIFCDSQVHSFGEFWDCCLKVYIRDKFKWEHRWFLSVNDMIALGEEEF